VDNCYANRRSGNSTLISKVREGEFNWDKETQSLVLSSFFWGYVLTQIPAGWLAQRFGGKRVLGIFMFFAVTSSLLSPVGARFHPYMLMVLRLINGMGQGAMFPVIHAVFHKWAPPLERSKLIGFTYAGSQIGNVVSLPISAVLCDYGFDGGWSSVFYVFGSSGAVVLALWLVVVSDSPSQHPRITVEEKDYIESSIGGTHQSHPTSTPWLKFLTCRPFYAIIIAQFCALWGSFTLLTNIPTYMKEILKFNIKSNGALSAIPYVLFWAFINAGGVTADYMRSRGFKTKNVRKLMLSLGSVIPAIFLIATGFVSCERPYLAVAMISLALGFKGLHFPGVMVNHADIAPPFAAVMFGIANSIGTSSGIFAPMVVGLLTPNGTQEEWRNVFYVCAGILCFGTIVFCLFADGEVQPWVRPYMDIQEHKKTSLQPAFTSISNSIVDIHGSQCLRE
jgi:MFS family permease